MFRKKQINPFFKSKQYLMLFMVILSSFQILFAQESFTVDSLLVNTQDSLQKNQQAQDSINFLYLSTETPASSYYLDSLKSIVIVRDNNFIGWMVNMNKIAAKNQEFAQMPAVLKVSRPAWILVAILILCVAIGLVRLFFYINFHNIIYGFYNDRILAQINKEDSIVTSWPYIFLYSIFTLSLGLFITLYQAYVLHNGKVEFVGFLKISVGIALLFLLKIIFIRIVGVLFEVEKFVREYVVFLYLFYFNSVLILMPLLLLVTFMPSAYFNFMLILFVIIIVILFLYRFLKTMLSLIGGFRFSIFYFILYLCTLEIAPILILVKSLNN